MWGPRTPIPEPRSVAIGQMTKKKIGVEGVQVETSACFVHQLQSICLRIVLELLVDPLHGLLDRSLTPSHSVLPRIITRSGSTLFYLSLLPACVRHERAASPALAQGSDCTRARARDSPGARAAINGGSEGGRRGPLRV